MGRLSRAVDLARYNFSRHPRAFVLTAAKTAAYGACIAIIVRRDGSWWLFPAAAITAVALWLVYWFIANANSMPAEPLPRSFYFETSRLEIRRVTPSDADELEKSLDDDFLQANGWTLAHRSLTIALLRAGDPSATIGQLVACDSNGTPCTFVSITNAKRGSAGPEGLQLGVWTTPTERGRGYSTEALAGVMKLIHNSGTKTIYLGTSESNIAMQTVIERSGAQFEYTSAIELPDGTMNTARWYKHTGSKNR